MLCRVDVCQVFGGEASGGVGDWPNYEDEGVVCLVKAGVLAVEGNEDAVGVKVPASDEAAKEKDGIYLEVLLHCCL